ncbi:hypothetical protein [Hydrogenophaga crocea]|uniref:Uncharacterized protein n=1 Tax=Hydrogenophaga crocea TaxID=2716225 RepID=A0A6G8ID81_9BURK|nr:hypothetical protein [Hydrogenophaga crocea]QIM51093.1 hypothetical protein G9Q37_02550 [Hydrogenophaga crocea]
MTEAQASAAITGRRKRRGSTLGLVLLMAAGLIWWNWQTLCIWAHFVHPFASPRVVFDADKAATLSAERRAEFERELFKEVYMWNTWSRRYNAPDGLVQREARWRAMAAEGFELAYLSLTVFEPSTVQVHNPLPALNRLQTLARQGDAGAMCLFSAISVMLPTRPGVDWSRLRAQARDWMQKGAYLGHPDCFIQLGGRLRTGNDGFRQDVARGTDLLIKALRAGYLRAAGSFWSDIDRQGLDSARNRRLVYCWGYQMAQYESSDADLSLRVYRNQAPREQQAALDDERNQLRRWHPALDECIALNNATPGE